MDFSFPDRRGPTRFPAQQRTGRIVRRGAFREPQEDEQLLAGPEPPFLDSDPWRVLRIQAEFVEGFEALAGITDGVSVFGSARVGTDDPMYEFARRVGRSLAMSGYPVITGGGPGIMEAANRGRRKRGASRSGATSSCRASRSSTRT